MRKKGFSAQKPVVFPQCAWFVRQIILSLQKKGCGSAIKVNFIALTLHFLCTTKFKRGSDGGIGRRAGLKHQWGNPCRFDPGSEYRKRLITCLLSAVFLLLGSNRGVKKATTTPLLLRLICFLRAFRHILFDFSFPQANVPAPRN